MANLEPMTPNPQIDLTDDPLVLLAGLDPEQRAVAEAISGPVVVMAGAGTGKTRAITHRIAYAVATGRHDPARTLAVTFTNRAAGEMATRLAGLGVPGVRVRTFHSAALRQLRWAWPKAIGGQMHEVIGSKSGLISTAAANRRVPTDQATIRDLATEIEWAKVVGLGPQDYPKGASLHGRRSPGGLTVEQAGEVYAAYELAKRQAQRIDFEDVLLLTVAILEENEQLRREVRKSFAHFTVDEFQDVSVIQQRLLDVWLGDRDDVCVVGDVSQTIYSFAGADPSHLLQFAKKYDDPTVVSLHRCYRCTPQVVAVAEDVIGSGVASAQLLATTKAHRVALRSQLGDGPTPAINQFADEPAEALAVVTQIQQLMSQGVSAREIAILVRINAVTEQFESALADAGIAYTIRGGRRFFERPEVRRGVSLLRGAARASVAADQRPDDPRTLVRTLLGSVGWTAAPPSDTGAVREAWESLSALVSLCDEVVTSRDDAGIKEIVAEIVRREEAQDAPSVDGVTLASLHAAKGMEWDAVFLVGLVDGVLPMSHATTPAQIEEERRLLYVGVTRARRYLNLSWAVSRLPGGRGRKPSRFLSTIGRLSESRANADVGQAVKDSARRKRKPAACRACGKALVTAPERSVGRCRRCPSSLNEDLLIDLTQWRSEQTAKQSAGRVKPLPAYVVATDATLASIAELQPQSLTELADIPGLGPVKLDAYASELLAILERHR
jgi:DNA helicase-2/ATP-dependent DNA helicase PcrA